MASKFANSETETQNTGANWDQYNIVKRFTLSDSMYLNVGYLDDRIQVSFVDSSFADIWKMGPYSTCFSLPGETFLSFLEKWKASDPIMTLLISEGTPAEFKLDSFKGDLGYGMKISVISVISGASGVSVKSETSSSASPSLLAQQQQQQTFIFLNAECVKKLKYMKKYIAEHIYRLEANFKAYRAMLGCIVHSIIAVSHVRTGTHHSNSALPFLKSLELVSSLNVKKATLANFQEEEQQLPPYTFNMYALYNYCVGSPATLHQLWEKAVNTDYR